MTETCFYILLSMKQERHGYNVIQHVREITNGEVIISPGTMYGTLAKLEGNQLICLIKEEEKRKTYYITPLGEEILKIEYMRIKRLYQIINENGGKWDEK